MAEHEPTTVEKYDKQCIELDRREATYIDGHYDALLGASTSNEKRLEAAIEEAHVELIRARIYEHAGTVGYQVASDAHRWCTFRLAYLRDNNDEPTEEQTIVEPTKVTVQQEQAEIAVIRGDIHYLHLYGGLAAQRRQSLMCGQEIETPLTIEHEHALRHLRRLIGLAIQGNYGVVLPNRFCSILPWEDIGEDGRYSIIRSDTNAESGGIEKIELYELRQSPDGLSLTVETVRGDSHPNQPIVTTPDVTNIMDLSSVIAESYNISPSSLRAA